ncbi:MAG TPA: thiamine pyrophosphate-dependent dehydrogenase E1 component subunit alpha [Candidatus Methylomirabilis sp.]|nr:thiamine pyrophosphate-dependent dehydrogenase E1 component subunit alpha [Candidatus Methylomirabilis sp.]
MGYSEQLTDKDLIQMYRWLVLIRAFEDRVGELWTQGSLQESPHGSQGQEAIAVGACYGLRPEDQALPSLRTRGAFIVRGVPIRVQMAGMYAKATGPAGGKATAHHMGDPKRGILLGSGIVGASITVAVGAALAFKLQRKESVVIDFFGDGGSQRGDFHEGLNFAGAFKLPVVFILENNGFAEMTPLSKHFAGTDFACRAQGYGFPGFRLDGNDVCAVYEAVQAAVARARAGAGPTLLECVTYRQRGHSESHPPTELRDVAEIERWRARDPILRMQAQLITRGVLTDALVQSIAAEAKSEIEDAVKYAEESPSPAPAELYQDVYAPEDPELVVGRRS